MKLHSAWLRTENKKQNVFDSESRNDSSFTLQKDTEVIHREVRRRNEGQLLREGEPVRILGNTSTEGFGEETLRTSHARRGADVFRCATVDYTSQDGKAQTVKLRTHVTPERIVEQIIDVHKCHCRFWDEIVEQIIEGGTCHCRFWTERQVASARSWRRKQLNLDRRSSSTRVVTIA